MIVTRLVVDVKSKVGKLSCGDADPGPGDARSLRRFAVLTRLEVAPNLHYLQHQTMADITGKLCFLIRFLSGFE